MLGTAHCVASVHSTHAPPAQNGVDPAQATGGSKVPFALHVLTADAPEQSFAPGWHMPQSPLPSQTLAPHVVPCGAGG